MRSSALMFAAFTLAACASAPRGPSDAEVRADLEAQVLALAADVTGGSADAVFARLQPDGRLVLNGVVGPDGSVLDTTLSGDQLRGFMSSIGPVPEFTMSPAQFSRDGDSATQTGTWSLAGGEQTGTFILEWRRGEEGMWRILSWTMTGG